MLSSEPAPNPYRAGFLGRQRDGHCLCFHYPLSDLNHPETFLFSKFGGGGGGGKKKKTGKKYLSHQNPTEIRMYRNGILLVIWPNPPGTLAKLFPGVDSMGAAKFLKVYKDEISHQFTNVKCDELSDVCVICKELGIIGKWFLETEMKVLTFAH